MNEESERQSFENFTFNAFNSQSILLDDANDPDKNVFLEKQFQDSVYYNVNEAKNEFSQHTNDSLSILHLNIRSLKKKL